MYLNAISPHQNVNFQKGSIIPLKQSSATPVESNFQITIPDILSLNKHYFQSSSGNNNQNPAFCVDIKPSKDLNKQQYEVNINKYNNPAILIQKDINAKNLPQTQLKIGKFGPTIEFIDKELGIKVQLLTDSQAKINDKLNVIIPKQKGNSEFEINKDISFNGNINSAAKLGGGELQVVTFYKEGATKQAVDAYINDKEKLYAKAIKGDYINEFQENRPNIMILAGGFGTRLFNLTGPNSNKPALKLPTRNSYRLMANALDIAAKSGMINDDIKGSNTNLVYLSGANRIKGNNVRKVIQKRNLGDGGCIAKSLFDGNTATDAPLIILNADTFTNADITRAYKAFLDHPDAAMLIPFYEANENRAKDFGLMAIDKKSNDGTETYQIKSFVEKPQNPRKDAKDSIVMETRNSNNPNYMANPGIYIFSPKALQLLQKHGDGLNKEFGLAKDFVTRLVNDCQEGKILDDDNNPMKCYTTKLEKKGGGAAYWDDLGLDVAIPQTFRDMAKETIATSATSTKNKFYGMPSFLLNDAVKNTDLESGIVFMNTEAKNKYQKFINKYPGFKAKGNVIVYNSIK